MNMHKSLIILLVLSFIFVCEGMSKADIVQNGLIVYYPMDEGTIDGGTVEDFIGENDGTIIGGVEEVEGRFGQALQFDGSSGKVDIPGTDDLMFNGIEEFTASAWVYRTGSGGGCCGPIIAQRDLSGWALRYDNRNVGTEAELIISPGWVGDDAGFGVEIPEEEWHYITGVLLDGNIYMYFDGELAAETAFGPGSVGTNGGTGTSLGGASDGYFDGIIDEALIYNRGLSAAEVKQNYESTIFFAVKSVGKLTTCWGEIKK
ncbi:hypothetical protein GF312_05540 [Candidatus Poribacteria bacterium]|nr:hypothetical protein [Candidatus Poribacteria bacterium]